MTQPPQPSPWDTVEHAPHCESRVTRDASCDCWVRRLQPIRQQVEAQHAEEVKTLAAKVKDAEEWADIVARGQSPCGHWKAYCYTEDGIGRHIDCWQCRAERAEAQLRSARQTELELNALVAQLQATVTAREQERCEWREVAPGFYHAACGGGSHEVVTYCQFCGKPLEITRLKGESQ